VLFPTLDYLLFLPLSALLYWFSPRPFRLAVLALSSLAFYASWRLAYVPVLIGVTAVAWTGGAWLAARSERGRTGRWPLVVVLAGLLAPLVLFKYWNWLSGDFTAVAAWFGVVIELPKVQLALPVGISFFTFQALAYVVDVSRDKAPERSVLRFVTFLTFFPQLVAGPIVRRAELLPQLLALPSLVHGQVGSGLYRIGRGMLKKVLLADIIRVGVVDPIFAEPSRFTSLELLVGLYAYTLQIYYDFSGYTDIALGSAKLFGIELPENFRRPYKATSVAGFWRRWHITLSNWVRDYIYYPLGGARVEPQARIYFNIMATLLIIGIWHGASWNFVVYGLLHGSAVAINRVIRSRTGRRPGDPLPGWWAWTWRFLLTFHFVVLARILFRSPDFATSWTYLLGLMEGTFVMPRFSMLAWAMLALGYAIHFSPDAWQERLERRFAGAGPALWVLGLAAATALCMLLGTGEQLAFIYYQF